MGVLATENFTVCFGPQDGNVEHFGFYEGTFGK